MSVLDEDKPQSRFFTDHEHEPPDDAGNNAPLQEGEDDLDSEGDSDDLSNKKCLTLRVIQRMCPCLSKKSLWDTSQNNIFKLNEVEETKYPLMLTILEHTAFDVVAVVSAVLSIFLLLFSEGFLIEGTFLWGVIHTVNAVYTFTVFGRWLEILLKSKFAKTNQEYSVRYLVYSFLSVLPLDICFLVGYIVSTEKTNTDGKRHPDALWLTPVRVLYLFRARTVFQFFNKVENQLGVGDLWMFVGRTVLYTITLVHFLACAWHRIHCESTVGIYIERRSYLYTNRSVHSYKECYNDNWIEGLEVPGDGPFQAGSDWHQYTQHYFVSMYWSTLTCFRLGASSIYTYLSSEWETGFSTFGQILTWIFFVTYVSGGLTSLLVEFDTEREKYLTRRFAIDKYLDFSDVSRKIKTEVNRFYDYLWTRSRGIHNWDMVKDLPLTMKSEIYYDINKFIMDQLPIMTKLSEGFLMSLSVRMKHNFYLKGEVLHRRGEIGATLFYVISGYLEVISSDGSFVVAEIRSGSAIGELNLLQSYPCVATVRCGTECDIMTLTKQEFKEVLENYPENRPILLQRLETRLEQSGLLLALCEKHNEYPHAFKQLIDRNLIEARSSKSAYRQSFDNINQLLDTSDFDAADEARDSSDFDDLSLSPDIFKRIHKLATATGAPVQKANTQKDLEAAACAALEADVHRAAALAKDLIIPRPPLVVTAPRNTVVSTVTGSTAVGRFSVRDRVVPLLTEKSEGRKVTFLLWKFLVTVSAFLALWYYTYQFAFVNHTYWYLDYAAHAFDLIFFVDFILDMFFITVNTPHRTLEHPREIGAYRVKTLPFWLRLFSFLPIEYALGPISGLTWNERYYYFFKFNRIIQYHQAVSFFSSFDGDSRVSHVALSFLRFTFRLFFVIHITACVMEVVLKETNYHRQDKVKVRELFDSKIRSYEFVFYWASEIATGTGFGDIELQSSWEFAVSSIGLIIGTLILMYLNARVSCIMVNAARRRVAFQQMFYGLRNFMSERRFPKWLICKVQNYYRVQWIAHEGTLIPHEQSAIWDAPKTLFDNVCLAQAQKYVERIPLFRHCNDSLILEICTALRQYIVPSHQVILYPSDRARDLYIIVKGHCEVMYNGESLGTLTEGRYMGLLGLIYGCNKPAQVSTLTHCQFFCLEFDDFVRISKKYPKFLHELKILRGEFAHKKEKVPPEECEIPLPTTDEDETLPPLFNAVEVTDNDVDSIAEKRNLEEFHSTRNNSFKRIKRKRFLSYFFLPVTIMPQGTFLKWWTVFRVICALYIGNFVPIQAAFAISPVTASATVFFFDIIAWIDILLCFHIGFFGYENVIVTDRTRTVLHYLQGPFLLDFLGAFPFDYLAMCLHPEDNGFDKQNFFTPGYQRLVLWRLNRMIQLYRIFVVGKILERTISKSLSFLTLVQVVPLMFLFLNVVACISFALVCGPSANGQVSCHPKAWFMDGNLFKNTFSADQALTDCVLSYLISFYFVAETSFCVGFGDFNIIQHAMNRKLAILIIMAGAGVSGYLVSKLTACLVGEDSRRIEIRDRTKILFKFLEQFKVPKDLRRRVKEACFAEWDKTKGIYPKDLFYALPPSLKCDALKRLYEQSLRQSPLFKDLDKPGMRMLSSKLSEMVYPEGEFVFKYGDLNDDVFFISKGVVVAYTKNGDIIRYIGAGSLLGEISPLFDIQRVFTAVAGTDAELYVFSREDFLDFLSLYPKIHKTLDKICLIHYKETVDATVREARSNSIISDSSRHSEDFRKSGLVIVKATESNAPLKKSQILLAEAVLDPLRLPAFMEEGDNVKESASMKSQKTRITFEKQPSYLEKFTTVFVTFGRRPRDEMGFIHFVPDQSKLTSSTAIIHPSSPICCYVSFYLFLTSLSCGLTAYEIAFSTYCGNEATTLLIMRLILEVFFILRIAGNFRLAYYNENSELVSNPSLIAKRYALDPLGFWVDVLATAPFYLISHFSGKENYRNKAFFRGLQFFRMILLSSYMRESESDLRMNTAKIKIIKISIILCFIFHFCACAWYRVACDGLYCTTRTWMKNLIITENRKQYIDHLDQNHTHPEINWPIESRYLLSLYYVCSAITFTGLGDIGAKRGFELVLTVLMIFTTVFVIGFLVGEMTQCLASQVAAKMHYRHRLRVMEHHFRNLGLSPGRIAEVKRYFMLLWTRSNGISYNTLLSHLPYSLRADLTMNVYGPNIKYSRIYGKLDKTIIRQLSAEIKHEIYMPGTHIVRSGDVCQAVYFIKRGEVVILDESPGVELCVEILYENECFGELKTILTGQAFRFSYVARLETEVGVIFHDDLVNVLKRHGRVYEEVVDNAKRMKERRSSIVKEHEQVARQSRSTRNTKGKASVLSISNNQQNRNKPP